MSPRTKRSPGGREQAGLRKGRIKVHDPFELIRWLALSQTDPRKALAELVQNSLDAGARSIEITRERIKGVPCLRIRDDGAGVIPELDRPDALHFIATNIGHSRKRSLTPSERLELMTQGQYGIGLLGFWCLGQTLELRSAIEGQRPHRLILQRDRPDYGIEPLRGRIAFDDQRWTEVVVVGLHREAMPALVAGRAAEYLAAELRGQLLMRDVALEIHDRMTRGLGQKRVTVRPKRFLGERIDLPPRLELPGHPPLQLEIYLRGDDTDGAAPGIGVYAAGTLVVEDFHALAALGLDHPPWTDSRLTGLVDFPALAVPPGSRRGVIPDAAAARFAAALSQVEPDLAGALERFDRRRAEALDSAVIRDLQRAFRDFYRQRPSYRMLPVDHKEDLASGPAGHSSARAGATANADPAEPSADGALGDRDDREGEDEPWSLFPPGPLTEVRIVPATIRIERGGRRQVRARPLDAAGRRVVGEVRYQWRLEGEVGHLEESGEPPLPADGDRIVVVAAAQPSAGSLEVTAVSGPRVAHAAATVEVVEELHSSSGRSDEGIPEPELVDEPGARWRSRMVGGAWQVNSGHPEFRLIADRPSLKLKYLALLFAKEIVLLSTHDPRLEAPLEQMVEVAAYADRKLDERRPGRRRRSKSVAD